MTFLQRKAIEPFPSQDDFQRCVGAWGLEGFRFVRKMENIVYESKLGGERVYLRLTTPLRRSKEQIEAELNWISQLLNAKLNVVRPLPTLSGEHILSLEHYEAVLFAHMEGEHPSEELACSASFLHTLGAWIACMHNASLEYQGDREPWDQERGLRHAREAASRSHNASYKEALEEMLRWMHSLPINKENHGIVHADLGALNLFVTEQGTLGVIDFDDSCYHWHSFDLAIVLYSMANRCGRNGPKDVWLEVLIEGYRTHRPLSIEEVAWIPNFIRFACLRLYFWIEHHQWLDTFDKTAQGKVRRMKEWAAEQIESP